MSTRYISADRNQPLLLPPDLREWVPDDDLVHFVIEAVDTLDACVFKVNLRGSGSAQYSAFCIESRQCWTVCCRHLDKYPVIKELEQP